MDIYVNLWCPTFVTKNPPLDDDPRVATRTVILKKYLIYMTET
jgi:hypothetical protein